MEIWNGGHNGYTEAGIPTEPVLPAPLAPDADLPEPDGFTVEEPNPPSSSAN